MSLFLSAKPGSAERATLASAAGDRAGSPVGRAAAAASLAHLLQAAGRGDEYLAAIRTTLNLFTDDRVPENVNWAALLGFTPTVDEMSYELGQELIRAGDAAGAVDVLKQGYALNKSHTKLTQALAEAFARTNQLGSALTILDELAMTHRKAGHLDEMAAVLRQMSQLAPANIKVKSRLVDAYLQRGFVAEARAELIQRADLEERAGMTKEAIISLQRAADLSWNLGFPQESFNLYDRILALDPEDVGNRSALVNLYLQVGRLSDAAEHQRAVVDLALTHGRKHEAIAALHQVIGLTPDDMTAYYQLGEALASMGEYQQAEKVYRRIVLMNPDDAIAQAKATTMAALKEQTSRA
jgi:tetratricopeptide (TPR) repeat protein